MMSTLKLFFSSLVIVTISLLIRARRRNRGIPVARGPPSHSWLTGHEMDIRTQLIAGENELKWTNQYGLVVRLAGCFGQSNLLVADPKALQYIFHTSGYRFPKTGDMHHLMNSVFGPGIITVEGEEHRRQRHILNPAFSVGQLRTFLGLFQAEGEKLTGKLEAHLAGKSAVVDILTWTTKCALDVLGLSSFRHVFGALDGNVDELAQSLRKIAGFGSKPTPAELAYVSLLRLLPGWSLDPLDSVVASRAYSMLKSFRALAMRISKDIVQNAVNDTEGLGEKDIVGILASSRLSDDKQKCMSQNAMMAQMATFIAAGQDTTSNTIGSLLYELAHNPGVQSRLRDEIREMLARKNGEPLTNADYDALPFMNACIKETLRFHPIAHSLIREAAQDDVLPLSEPLILEDGTTSMELPVKKGQVVYTSILVYQRLQNLWGKDADVWNPDRFLDEPVRRNGSNVGVYANLLTFSAGNRACLGWRFALMQLQVFTVLMVNKFSYEPDAEIKFAPTQIGIFPALEGKYEEGNKIPLKVKALVE